MFLSRVEIDSSNRQKMKKLSHVGAYHDWVERCFPKEIELHERSRKLWRIDEINNKTYLLLLSEEVPDLEKLSEFGVSGTAQTKNYDSFLSKLFEGQKLRFRVVLNPVVAVKEEGSSRGKIKPHVTVEQQMKFLLDRAEINGFALESDDFRIVDRKFIGFKRKGENVPRLSFAAYEGLLTIRNLDLFINLLTKGLGKKKAYGFGLMTVIPME